MKIESLINEQQEVMLLVSTQFDKLMKERKLDTARVVQATGISTTSINMIKRGEGNPSLSNLIKLSRFFGVPLSYFVDPDYDSISNLSKLQPIRVYDMKEKSFKQNKELYIMTLNKEHYPTATLAVRVNDDSLSPMFMNGTVFIVSELAKINKGDTVVVRTKKGHLLRKFYVKGDEAFFLTLDIQSEIEVIDKYEIVGSVVGIQPGQG